MRVAIVDYGSGNLRSAAKAFERAAHEADCAATIQVTRNPETVCAADRIVLPGVGAFADCRAGLDAVDGMVDALRQVVERSARPFLGICVGLQLCATRGLEFGETPGFGWIPGDVVAMTPDDRNLKIPHMGWNTLSLSQSHQLFDGIETGAGGLHAYFVHSYHLQPADPADLVATTEYGGTVSAAAAHGTVAGTQFHPEKSQTLGLRLIANFLRWSP